MATQLLLQSWACLTCGYTLPHSIDPFGDYFTTKMLFMTQAPSGQALTIYGCPAGVCPSCYYNPDQTQRATHNLEYVTDLSQPDIVVATTTLDSNDLATLVTAQTDADGNPVMVDTGKTEYKLDPTTGQVVSVPVMDIATRPLTTQEQTDKNTQAQQTLDQLSPYAIQDTTAPTTETVI